MPFRVCWISAIDWRGLSMPTDDPCKDRRPQSPKQIAESRKPIMVRKLIAWAVNNPLIVILVMLGLAGFGTYAFLKVNVEAYPDPAPAIIEVIAQFPGASAEEVERQVTIPLEVTLAGMPGLK